MSPIIFKSSIEDFLDAVTGTVYINATTAEEKYPPITRFYVNLSGYDAQKNPIMLRAEATWEMTFNEYAMGIAGKYLNRAVQHTITMVQKEGRGFADGGFAVSEFTLGYLQLPDKNNEVK